MRIRHPLAATALLATTVLFLTACTGGGEASTDPTTDETTTEPTEDPTTEPPTDDPSQSYRDDQIAAAEDFILDFYATANEVRQDGYENWEPRLFPFFTGDDELWQLHSGGYRQDAEAGISTEGTNDVYSIEATNWEEAPEDAEGFDTVTFDLCIDARSVVYLNEDGSENEERTSGIPDHRFPTEIEVMGQPESELGWSLMTFEADSESSC
ncbi:MAG TPA: hypothetical protein VK053_06870 [Jiangellaceae bacterium]|nr:hypothetical protein [Jiangellaceae bacterium]